MLRRLFRIARIYPREYRENQSRAIPHIVRSDRLPGASAQIQTPTGVKIELMIIRRVDDNQSRGRGIVELTAIRSEREICRENSRKAVVFDTAILESRRSCRANAILNPDETIIPNKIYPDNLGQSSTR
jgi:hypothetical protein